jgi:alkaline phosphatase D
LNLRDRGGARGPAARGRGGASRRRTPRPDAALLRPAFLAVLFAILAGLPGCAQGPVLERVMFGSCVLQTRPQPIFDTVASLHPDLFVFLGDNIYADTRNPDVMARKYAQLAGSGQFRRLLGACPVEATWDDHDYGQNDAGAEYPMKERSRELFLQFWKVPRDSPRWRHPGVYSATLYGPPGRRVQLILLDMRSFRSPLRRGNPNPTDDLGPYVPWGPTEPGGTPPTLLGEEQWRWLERQLREEAQLRVIASSIQVVNDQSGWECWGNFPDERRRLYALLQSTRAGGTVFISGDRHFAELSLVTPPGLYPLYDLTSSALNFPHPSGRTGTNSHRVGGPYTRPNFGMLKLSWGPPATLTLQIRDQEGTVRVERSVRLDTLQLPPGR